MGIDYYLLGPVVEPTEDLSRIEEARREGGWMQSWLNSGTFRFGMNDKTVIRLNAVIHPHQKNGEDYLAVIEFPTGTMGAYRCEEPHCGQQVFE